MDSHLIGSLDLLLLLACIVALIAQWLRQPYTIALVLVGLVVAVTKLAPSIRITHDVIFALILPPLLFQGALHMDLEGLRRNWSSIALLAIPGVVISTLVVACIVHYLWPLEWIYALLFGALITPTDPISVLAILKKVGAPERLRVMLEGESLFNDGTGVVLFSVVLALVTGQETFHLGHSAGKFLLVTGGGTLIGFVIGYLAFRLLKSIDDHLLEVSITVVLAYGTPLLAEALHCSGIISIVVAGLIMGNYGRVYSMSEKSRETMENFWEVIDFIINSLLFLVIGIELQEISAQDFSLYWQPCLVGIMAVLVARLIVVYPVVKFKNAFSSKPIPPGWNHVLFWGGLKGSIPIALVMGLPIDVKYRSLFLTTAFAIVLFSLVIQGLTMQPLLQRLGVGQNE